MKDLINNVERMTSIEIAEVTGKQHKNVMQAIRNMESAWEKVNGLKFQLVEYRDKKGELRPCYSLTKTECLSSRSRRLFFKPRITRITRIFQKLKTNPIGI